MPLAENIQTMQAFLGYFNPAKAEQMAQGCRAHVSADERLLHCLSALQRACPDLEVIIEDMIAEGDRVAVRFTGAGGQDGGGRALAPGILIYRVAEGKIVEHWMQPDVPALLQMLGAGPTPTLP
jgi:predicted ester cyclase